MNKKITKKDNYNLLLTFEEVKANPAIVNFINHEIELLNRKNSTTDRKPTVKQAENESIKAVILATLNDTPRTISHLQKDNEILSELQNQKISALIRQLVISGEVVRTEEKKKAYFALA